MQSGETSMRLEMQTSMVRWTALSATVLFVAPVVFTSCGATRAVDAGAVDGDRTDGDRTDVDAGADAGLRGPRCTATALLCRDQASLDLRYRTVISDGEVAEEGPTPGATTYIDARAGGSSTPQSYTYVAFGDANLSKVALTDEQALDSLDWDLAFRRFVIRVNSGNSGPSCVEVADLGSATIFDSVSGVPSGVVFRSDLYYGDAPDAGTTADGGVNACVLQYDSGGINGPNTALATFWAYPVSCVQTTGNVYILRLRDGRHVKLQVLSYYHPTAQAVCNDAGTVDPATAGSASFRIRWAFIPAP